jgi:hypothetical protein
VVVEPTYLAANTAAMAKKPEPPKLVTWDVYRAAHKPKIVGSVQAVAMLMRRSKRLHRNSRSMPGV